MTGIFWALLVLIPSFFLYLILKRIKGRAISFFHFIWLILLISTFTLRGRTTGELLENPLDYAGMFRAFLVLFSGLLTYIYMLQTGLEKYLKAKNIYIFSLLLYAIMGALSAIYSPIPKLSLYKSIEVLISLSVVMVFVSFRNLRRLKILFDVVYIVLFILIASAWFWAILKPEVAIARMGYLNFVLYGYFPKQDADMVSVNAALLAIGSYVRMRFFPKGGLFYKLIFLFSLATLIAGQARTSIFGFLLALAFIYFLLGERLKLFSMIMLIVMSLSIDQIYNALYQFVLKGSRPEVVMRIGGRLKWWKLAFPYFLTSPIWGHGFSAGIRAILLEYNPNIFSVHNTFLEIAVNLGLIGLLLFSFAYFGAFVTLVKYFRRIGRHSGKTNSTLFSLILEGIGLMIILTARASTSFTQGEHGTAYLVFLTVLALAESLKYIIKENEGSGNSLRM